VRTSVGSGYVLSGTVLAAEECKPIRNARIEFCLALRGSNTLKAAAGMKDRQQDRRVMPAMVNVRGLPCVIPDNMLSAGQESDEQTRAYQKRDESWGSGSNPWSRRARQDGGASARFRSRVGGANLYFGSGGCKTTVVVMGVATAVADGNVA
jgi:hypothetical protein